MRNFILMNDEFILNGDPYDVCLVVMGILLNHYREEGIPPDFDHIKEVCLQIIEMDERSNILHSCQCEYFESLNNYQCYYCKYIKPYEGDE